MINLLTEGEKEDLTGIEEVFKNLLEESDNETKFKLFKKIKDFKQIKNNLTLNILQTILTSLQTIAQSKKWRMRSSVLTTISKFILETELNEDQFQSTFIDIIKNGLNDTVADVRLQAAKTIGNIAAHFSPSFT